MVDLVSSDILSPEVFRVCLILGESLTGIER
jgi:hypothetical protein